MAKKLDFSKTEKRYLEITFPDGKEIKIHAKKLTLNNIDEVNEKQNELNKKKDDDKIKISDYWIETFKLVAEYDEDLLEKVCSLECDHLIAVANELTELQMRKSGEQKKSQ